MKSPKSSRRRNRLKVPVIIRRVVGHSMVPVLPPRTLVFAHGFSRRLKKGDIVIIVHENMEKIKRISEVRPKDIFVLGDHPETSTDSRHFGWIAKKQVIAKVFWPRTRT